MRYFEVINNALIEGRVYDINTGYGNVMRTTRIYMNPVPAQAETLAKSAMKSNGLLYLRGVLIDGKTLYVAEGHAATHDDLIREFLPNVEERDSRITTFEITNYRMNGITPTMTEVTLYTAKPGDYDVHTSSAGQKLLAGCKAATK